MDTDEVIRIKEIIKKAQEESLKAQGAIDSIKKEWKEKYGTDDVSQIKKLLSENIDKLEVLRSRKTTVYDELVKSCDWDALSEKLEIR